MRYDWGGRGNTEESGRRFCSLQSEPQPVLLLIRKLPPLQGLLQGRWAGPPETLAITAISQGVSFPPSFLWKVMLGKSKSKIAARQSKQLA